MLTGDEPEVEAIDGIMRIFVQAGKAGRWLVDLFPALEILPEFLAGWKKASKLHHEYESALHIKNLREGRAAKGWNWAKHYFSSDGVDGMSELEVAYDRKSPIPSSHQYPTNKRSRNPL
jgi:hypothetical protein